jgi:hypothetical protein
MQGEGGVRALAIFAEATHRHHQPPAPACRGVVELTSLLDCGVEVNK